MRYLTLSSLLLLCCAACADDDANASGPKSVETSPDAGNGSGSTKTDAGSGETAKDAGKDAAAASGNSRLPRPSLPRAPGAGLPADLRPPR